MGSQRLDQLAEAAGLDGSELLYVLKDGTDRHIKSDTYAETGDRVLLWRDYDVHPDNPALDNREGINQAISDAFADRRKVELLLLPGTHAIDAKVGYDASSTTGAFIHLKGAGRHSTKLEQQDDTADVMSWTNTVSNTTALLVDDLGLSGGARAIYLLRTAYTLWRNIAFDGQVSPSLSGGDFGVIETDGTTNDTVFQNAYAVHCNAAYMVHNIAGERLYFYGSTLGEDVGGIRSQGYTVLSGCDLDVLDKASSLPAGGVSALRVQNGGLWVTGGSQLRIRGDADQVFNYDVASDNGVGPTGLFVTDCMIEMLNGCDTFLFNNRMSSPSAVAKITDNVIRFNGTNTPKTLLEEGTTTESNWVKESNLTDNTIEHDASVTAQFHDGVFDRSRNNRVGNNTVVTF